MAKGQKRTSKEAKKTKSGSRQDKKQAGPKYLRESEMLQVGVLGASGGGKKR